MLVHGLFGATQYDADRKMVLGGPAGHTPLLQARDQTQRFFTPAGVMSALQLARAGTAADIQSAADALTAASVLRDHGAPLPPELTKPLLTRAERAQVRELLPVLERAAARDEPHAMSRFRWASFLLGRRKNPSAGVEIARELGTRLGAEGWQAEPTKSGVQWTAPSGERVELTGPPMQASSSDTDGGGHIPTTLTSREDAQRFADAVIDAGRELRERGKALIARFHELLKADPAAAFAMHDELAAWDRDVYRPGGYRPPRSVLRTAAQLAPYKKLATELHATIEEAGDEIRARAQTLPARERVARLSRDLEPVLGVPEPYDTAGAQMRLLLRALDVDSSPGPRSASTGEATETAKAPEESDADLILTASPEAGIIIEGDTYAHRGAIKDLSTRFRWSRRQKFWYVPHSRERVPKRHQVEQIAQELRDAGATVDVRLSFHGYDPERATELAEQRGELRAETLEARADRQAKEAAERMSAVDQEYDKIPLGQPVMGRADRNRRAKLHARNVRALELYKQAEETVRRKAATERNTARFNDPSYWRRRHERHERELGSLKNQRAQYQHRLMFELRGKVPDLTENVRLRVADQYDNDPEYQARVAAAQAEMAFAKQRLDELGTTLDPTADPATGERPLLPGDTVLTARNGGVVFTVAKKSVRALPLREGWMPNHMFTGMLLKKDDITRVEKKPPERRLQALQAALDRLDASSVADDPRAEKGRRRLQKLIRQLRKEVDE